MCLLPQILEGTTPTPHVQHTLLQHSRIHPSHGTLRHALIRNREPSGVGAHLSLRQRSGFQKGAAFAFRLFISPTLMTVNAATRGALLLAFATRAFATDGMGPIELYLRQFGVPQLPKLAVSYADQALHGEALHFYLIPSRTLLSRMPTVTWDGATTECAMLLFFDIDCGGRPANDTDAGSKGPYVHSLWINCKHGNAATCNAIKPYKAPGNSRPVPNRYTWMLLRHACGAILKLPTPRQLRGKLSFSTLLRENAGLTPVATNFMFVGGDPATPPPARASRRG